MKISLGKIEIRSKYLNPNFAIVKKEIFEIGY